MKLNHFDTCTLTAPGDRWEAHSDYSASKTLARISLWKITSCFHCALVILHYTYFIDGGNISFEHDINWTRIYHSSSLLSHRLSQVAVSLSRLLPRSRWSLVSTAFPCWSNPMMKNLNAVALLRPAWLHSFRNCVMPSWSLLSFTATQVSKRCLHEDNTFEHNFILPWRHFGRLNN